LSLNRQLDVMLLLLAITSAETDPRFLITINLCGSPLWRTAKNGWCM